MTYISISTAEDLVITTTDNGVYKITVHTYLGSTIFSDTINAVDNIIVIKGLEKGKYIVRVSNDQEFIKQKIILK
ncbi:T9SS type A sorting domain-containing protein [Lutibacter sp.]